jgi:Glycosyltransferase family 9 (heptosyltransferase)
MGLGDNIMATGLAKGAVERGKRIAFGDRRLRRTQWDRNSEEIFRHNPNIARPGTERAPDVEWIDFRSGNRHYNKALAERWLWYDFHPKPGEFFFDEAEESWAAGVGSKFVLIEPNVAKKPWAENKQWPFYRYDEVAAELMRQGHEVVQFIHGGTLHKIPDARLVKAPSFRQAVAGLAQASLYIGPEGGMHHGAAAVGVSGVIIFGGFASPRSTGYDSHVNLTGGSEACGHWRPCRHCLLALHAISVEQVLDAAEGFLRKKTPRVRVEKRRHDDIALRGTLHAHAQ